MAEQDCREYWHNYRTGKADVLNTPMTDAQAEDHIPQDAGAQGLYRAHRMNGKSIPEAVVEVLTVVIEASEKGAPNA